MLKQPSNGFIAGLIVGTLIITLMNVFGFRNHPESTQDAVLTSDASARAFVADWTRMRTSTWAVDSTFTRVTDAGQQLTTTLHQAQQSPNSIQETADDADVILDGEHYICTKGVRSTCRNTGPISFEESASMDVASVSGDVLGAGKTYDVEQLPNHCYSLYLRPPAPGALNPDTLGQWGTQGTVCFDAQTGAPVRSVIKRPGAVDTVVSTAVRARPAINEIRLPSPVA